MPHQEPCRLRRVAVRYLLPALAGFALAGVAVMCCAAMGWTGGLLVGQEDPQVAQDATVLVRKATGKVVNAEGQAEEARALRRSSAEASRKAEALEQELGRVEASEAERDRIAVRETQVAKAAEIRAESRDGQKRSVSSVQRGLFQEAKIKRAAFLR